jgi:hypothetical protein
MSREWEGAAGLIIMLVCGCLMLMGIAWLINEGFKAVSR